MIKFPNYFIKFPDRLRQTLHVQHQNELEQQNLQFEEEIDYIKDDLKKTKDMRSKEVSMFLMHDRLSC